jgi:penicillin-binding protein 2
MIWPFRSGRYHVDVHPDDWVTPEETLVDAASSLADVERPVGEGMWSGFGLVAAMLGVVLAGATAFLTIARHDDLAQIAWRNRTVNVAVSPPRGIIMDRTGLPLVVNVPSFDILVISRQVRRADDGTIANIGRLADALGKNAEELTLAIDDGTGSNAVFFLATDVTRDQVLAITDNLPAGFYLITSTKRQYPDGDRFAHLIGYVGKVSKADIARDDYYGPADTVGRLGVESSYEEVLRGTHGRVVFSTNGAPENEPAAPGGNVVLHVDARAQRLLSGALDAVLRENGLLKGAAVVQDPSSGAVLALASFPTYDNNVFTGTVTQDDVSRLFESAERPLFNRVIAGQYNPGSTIKPLIGMAGLEEGIMQWDTVVTNDCISLTIPNPTEPERPYVFENWRPDTGPFTLGRAIADSCNIYFFKVGGGFEGFQGLGIERISRALHASFADTLLGMDLPGERTGNVPDPDTKWKEYKEPWYQGDTYNVSIGQGDLVVTPLWINTLVSAIANGGTLWRPTVVDRIVDEQRQTLHLYSPRQLGSLPFDEDTIEIMQNAMRQTVRDGTARALQDVGVTVAAKTGTAEVVKGRRVNSLITLYAPADNPRIALTILIEGTSLNQGYALRAAHAFLASYFSTKEPTPTPLPFPTASASASLSPSPVASP